MNVYVPWDVSVLDTFLAHIKGAIGASVSTGVLILGAILGVGVVIMVVKRFSRG